MKVKIDDGPPIDLPEGFTLDRAREAVMKGKLNRETRRAERLLLLEDDGRLRHSVAQVATMVLLPHDIFRGLVLRTRGTTAWKEYADHHPTEHDADPTERGQRGDQDAQDQDGRAGEDDGRVARAPDADRQGAVRGQQGSAQHGRDRRAAQGPDADADGPQSGRQGAEPVTATKTKPKRTKVTPEHVSLAKQGYNPLISIHFKGLRRSDKVDLYDTYYERKNRAC